jgi:cytochrome P450
MRVRRIEPAPTPATAAIGTLTDTTDVEPWGYFDSLRAAGDVVWDEQLGAWLVSSFDLIKQMSRDDDTLWRNFALDAEFPPPSGLSVEEWVEFKGFGSSNVIHMVEGEAHRRMHGWWARTFSPRVLGHWKSSLFVPLTNDPIDRFIDRGRAELVSEFVDQLVPKLIAGVMGLPLQDHAWLMRMADLIEVRLELSQLQDVALPGSAVVERALTATRDLREMLVPYVRKAESGGADNLISTIWRDAERLFGSGWSEADVVATAFGVWEGAVGTTMYGTANGLYLLLTDAGLQEQLRAGDERLIKNLGEETLRLFGPFAYSSRFAKQDTELGGHAIRRGELVIAMTNCAGRDPEKYECAHRVDLERPAPRDHFSFYQGPRACPGQGLARIQMGATFDVVLDRLQHLRLDPEADAPRFREVLQRRWAPLHAVFDIPA